MMDFSCITLCLYGVILNSKERCFLINKNCNFTAKVCIINASAFGRLKTYKNETYIFNTFVKHAVNYDIM